MAKPKLIAFDLDYTLWPFWVDTHVTPPFRKQKDGKVYDSREQVVTYYPDVPDMLTSLSGQGIALAAASRTPCTDDANSLLNLFDWDRYFTYKEIYPGCKLKHFERFQKNSGLEYEEMLFFDDEYRNIRDVSERGVTCIHAEDGMSTAVLQRGLNEFAQNRKKAGQNVT